MGRDLKHCTKAGPHERVGRRVSEGLWIFPAEENVTGALENKGKVKNFLP